jgi:hypothetical protein
LTREFYKNTILKVIDFPPTYIKKKGGYFS